MSKKINVIEENKKLKAEVERLKIESQRCVSTDMMVGRYLADLEQASKENTRLKKQVDRLEGAHKYLKGMFDSCCKDHEWESKRRLLVQKQLERAKARLVSIRAASGFCGPIATTDGPVGLKVLGKMANYALKEIEEMEG